MLITATYYLNATKIINLFKSRVLYDKKKKVNLWKCVLKKTENNVNIANINLQTVV